MLHMVLLQIESGTFPPNIIKIGQHLTYLLLKEKGCQFFETQCIFQTPQGADIAPLLTNMCVMYKVPGPT